MSTPGNVVGEALAHLYKACGQVRATTDTQKTLLATSFSNLDKISQANPVIHYPDGGHRRSDRGTDTFSSLNFHTHLQQVLRCCLNKPSRRRVSRPAASSAVASFAPPKRNEAARRVEHGVGEVDGESIAFSSMVVEDWLPFLPERDHAFDLVGGSERCMNSRAFVV